MSFTPNNILAGISCVNDTIILLKVEPLTGGKLKKQKTKTKTKTKHTHTHTKTKNKKQTNKQANKMMHHCMICQWRRQIIVRESVEGTK